MSVRVVGSSQGHRLVGAGPVIEAGNGFLDHLAVRAFSPPATVRAYTFDLANFVGFLDDRSLELDAVVPTDLFDYLDWQTRQVAGQQSGGGVAAAGSGAGHDEPPDRRSAACSSIW